MHKRTPEVAILIPCKDESTSIAKVIKAFQRILPNSSIYIGDNNSSDGTAAIAKNLGCNVVFEFQSGKGNTVRRLLKEVEADYFVLIDGDDTYDTETVLEMLDKMVALNLDMVIARRITAKMQKKSERPGHILGNLIINKAFNFIFKSNYQDVLSGYRILSSDFAQTFPSKSTGFEIEVELNAHASWMNASVLEIDSNYKPRSDGSTSKLRTFNDGIKIFKEIVVLSRRSKPIRHFFVFFFPFAGIALYLVSRAVVPYFSTGYVKNVPSLIVGTSLFLLVYTMWSNFLVMEQSISNHLSLTRLMQKRSKKID
jgi:glycosyltransferase involved in cell wall biosynthesis